MHRVPQCSIFSLPFCVSLNSPARRVHPLRAPVLQVFRRLTAQFPSPLSSLGFHKAKRGGSRPHRHQGSPAVLMALGRRHEQEDLCDLLSAAMTRCLEPASDQAQQPDKAPILGCTALRSRRRILKAATSNNSCTNLRIGELEWFRCWRSE